MDGRERIHVRQPALRRTQSQPRKCALPAPEHLLPRAEVEVMRVDAGHVSLFAGRDAVKTVMPGIFEWLEGHSEELQ